jgi:hypothetical protein
MAATAGALGKYKRNKGWVIWLKLLEMERRRHMLNFLFLFFSIKKERNI